MMISSFVETEIIRFISCVNVARITTVVCILELISLFLGSESQKKDSNFDFSVIFSSRILIIRAAQ